MGVSADHEQSSRLPAVPVTFIGSHAGLGGSESVLEALLAELGPAWVDRVILLGEGPAVERLRGLDLPVEVLPTGRRAGLLTGAWRLRARLRSRRPTVVHANGVKAALVAVVATLGTGAPVLWHKHDFSWDGPLARLIAAGCAEVVGVSAAVLERLRRGRPRELPRPRLCVVPNGVADVPCDRVAARAALAAELGLEPEAPLVALVGRLHPAKGQLELLGAAPALWDRHPEARILLVGAADPAQPAYAQRVDRAASELGGDVRRLGHREDARAIVAAADVLVLPSVADERGMGREGFGLAGVEALAAGTPVVGYEGGALGEVLGDAAVLVAAGNRPDLGAAIAELLGDPERRAAMTAVGRRRFEQRYRLERAAATMAERYRLAAVGRARTTAQPPSSAASAAITFERRV